MNHPSEPNLYRARAVISQLRACYIMRLEQLRADKCDNDTVIEDFSKRIARLSRAHAVLSDNVMGQPLHIFKRLLQSGDAPPENGFKAEREWQDLVDVKPTELEPT